MRQMTSRWFEQPEGMLVHGVEIARTYVTVRAGKYHWFSTKVHSDVEFASQQEATHAAEEAIRCRLAEAVAVMGGHVVWARNTMDTSDSSCS
jgi:hypothetical protein